MADTVSEEDLLMIAVTVSAAHIQRQKKKKKPRQHWAKAWLMKRPSLSHTSLMEELRLEPTDWFNYLRMDEANYRQLLALLTPLIQKQDTCMRRSISPHERLSATLRFLATGRSYEDLKFSAAISPQALGHIIPDTCKAIWQALHKEYLKVSIYFI